MLKPVATTQRLDFGSGKQESRRSPPLPAFLLSRSETPCAVPRSTLSASAASLRRMAKPKTVKLTLDRRLPGDLLTPDTDLGRFVELPAHDSFL